MLGFIIGVIGDQIVFCPAAGPCTSGPTATDLLAQQNNLVFAGAYYQLFTSIFVTDSVLDVGFNAIAVLILDFFLPDTMNNTRYFIIFLASALLGNLLTLLEGPNYASAGASGGIFGVFAAAFAYGCAENKKVDLSTAVLFLALFVSSSFLVLNVNWVAHLGGSIGGFILGPLLYFSVRQTSQGGYGLSAKSSPTTITLLLLIVSLMIVGCIIQFLVLVTP